MNIRELQEYAWGWFEYHAGQRLVAFRFFLVFLGALMIAFSTSLKEGYTRFSSRIAIFGGFISFAFFMLEIRNEQLVNRGRKALAKLEESEDFQQFPDLKLFRTDSRRNLLFSYKVWFRMIYCICVVTFLILAFCPTAVI